ncbi:MAG: PorP/SprF family type IX secretion system membrane protein [Thermoflexibacter sp.]|jgi:type IX secretion system PorP/SprF family membrane protein|nr:PorP/SprF family type IX secretion system membrane protein [Thermoflexibacter sp.]
MRKLTFLLFIFIAHVAFSQDPQFTQFYNAPLVLNPALTGSTEQFRGAANYRNQWLLMNSNYVSTTFSFDYNANKLRSGFGFLASYDNAGANQISATSFSGLYSFYVPFKGWQLRLGIQGGLTTRRINTGNLIFVSQVLDNDPDVDESGAGGSTLFFDVSSGMTIYNKNMWFGFAAHHLNRPDQSLFGGGSALPTKYSVQLGGNFKVYAMNSYLYLMPVLLFKKQGSTQQLDIGCRFMRDDLPLEMGVFYRGLPILPNAGKSINQDALAFAVGWRTENWTFGYSYDLTISGLTPLTGGSHEISIIYEYATRQRKLDQITCPIYARPVSNKRSR